MRAVVLREFGAADVLRPGEVPDPVAEPGWVTVRLKAAALNWHDVLVRRGQYGSPLPHVPGADGAGIRADTGEEVVIVPSLWWGADESAPARNWEILGDHRPGTYAELVRVPAECLAPRPAGYSWAQAAALPLVGLTTYRALFTRARLRAGESLLVLGAGGGIATTAVTFACGIGASAVVTSSSRAKIEQAQALGAKDGVLYTETGWEQAAKKLSPGGRGFDVVLDSAGTWAEALTALRPGGRLVVLGANAAEHAPIDVRRFYFGQYSLLGTTMGGPQDFAGLLRLLGEHPIAPPVLDRTFPLAEAAAAHRHLEQGGGFGKVVLLHD
ncbi:zinc-binding dehydrogenase [Amycolatopsis acidiphila]|uniref:Zinc-binding dehydrogenase n=1 Tax=Amycolatopsis acidiphila TaxID=715473 RepID=A0A558AM01_9PSEU|nr:zinc-binding dehydrogenase [Amycolatopsis acidiphila]TVT25298.1 zinc-binding dehydrogenase [Amycolatopsis acidiphila]UIJ62421.1 zinc-binding dehydrogenase [Amycolatopsis acidiphila]GHG83596.1 alcohol dehydrogenase [Amycolatopsis acidiphila]